MTKLKMSSTPTAMKRLKGKKLTEVTHYSKEKLEAPQLFSLVYDLDLAGLFALITVSCPEKRKRLSNAVAPSMFPSLLAHQVGAYFR